MGDADNTLPPSKKRAAGRELSRDNPSLDDEEEVPGQESGTFKRASEEVLANRRIVKVRRSQTSSTPSAPSSNPFAAIRLVPPTNPTPVTPVVNDNVKDNQEVTKPASEEAKDNQEVTKPASEEAKDNQEVAKPASEEAKDNQEVTKPASEEVKDNQEVTKPASEKAKDNQEVTKPASEEVKDNQEVTKPASEEVKDNQEVTKLASEEVKDNQEVTKPASEETKTEEQTTDGASEVRNIIESAKKDEEPASVNSFQQLSSSQNAFTGLVGSGFSTSTFSFGSISKTEPTFPSFSFGTNGNSSLFNKPSDNKPESTTKIPSMQEVHVETGEENEKPVFTADSVLFEFLDGGWKERGKGELKINVLTNGTGRARLVMRARGNYRLILNASIFPDMKLTNMEKKGVTFACLNSTGEEKEGLSTFALKFKDASIVDEFRSAVAEHKGNTVAASALKTPENSPKASDE